MTEQTMIAGIEEGNAVTLYREQAAHECHERVMKAARLAVESFIDYAGELKKIRDNRYYIELGFESFDQYTKQYFEISDGQASKYITVLDNKERLPEEFFSPGRKIEISKLYLLTTLDDEERNKFLKDHEDIDGLSKSEMEAEIKELKEKNKKLEEESQLTFDSLESFRTQALDAKAQLIKAGEEKAKISAEKEKIEKDLRNYKSIKKRLEDKLNKIQSTEPEKEIVTVTDESEIKRLKDEIEKKEKEISGLSRELENVQKPEAVIRDEIEIFKAYFKAALRSVSDLIEFYNEHEGSEHKALYDDKIKALIVMLDIGGVVNEVTKGT